MVAGDVEFGGGQGLEVGLHEALAPADHVDVLGAENRRRSSLSGVYTGEKTLYVVTIASSGDLKRWENFY